jgi:hypothetical protein
MMSAQRDSLELKQLKFHPEEKEISRVAATKAEEREARCKFAEMQREHTAVVEENAKLVDPSMKMQEQLGLALTENSKTTKALSEEMHWVQGLDGDVKLA